MIDKTIKSNHMSFEEALGDPSLSHFHEVIHFLEKNKDTILFPKKFMSGLKSILSMKIRRILKEQPDLQASPLKLLIETLIGVNEKLPPEMIIEITAHIIKEWETLTVSTKQATEELELV